MVKRPNPLNTGVYTIRNSIDNTTYVGSAAKHSILFRWKTHIRHLKSGVHRNRHLQRAWKKYGEMVFEFLAVENVPATECVSCEQVKSSGSISMNALLEPVQKRAKQAQPTHVFNDDERTVVWVMTTGDLDRDNETVDPMGGIFEEFLANPAVPYNHTTDSFGIGRVLDEPWNEMVGEGTNYPEIPGEARMGLLCRIEFDDDPDSDKIYRKVKKGFIKAGSISFLPEGNIEKNDRGGNHYPRWRLLEMSVCLLGSNPSSLATNKKSLHKRKTVDQWAELVVNEVSKSTSGTYGVFHWNERGNYPTSQALRTYRAESAANRFVDRERERNPSGNRGGLVVRQIEAAPAQEEKAKDMLNKSPRRKVSPLPSALPLMRTSEDLTKDWYDVKYTRRDGETNVKVCRTLEEAEQAVENLIHRGFADAKILDYYEGHKAMKSTIPKHLQPIYADGFTGYFHKSVNPYRRPGVIEGTEWQVWQKGFTDAEANEETPVVSKSKRKSLEARQQRNGSFGLFDTVTKSWTGDSFPTLSEAMEAV